MNRIGVRIAAVLTVGLLFGATACGGGSDDSSSNGDAITAENTGSDASSSGSDSGSSGSDSSSDLDDLGDAMDALGGECMQAGLAYFALSMQALGTSFGASEADLEEMQSSIGELRAEIPSEIEDDFDVYADALQEYGEAMSGMNLGDLVSGDQQAQDAAEILESPEVTRAQENIDEYFDQNCPN